MKCFYVLAIIFAKNAAIAYMMMISALLAFTLRSCLYKRNV